MSENNRRNDLDIAADIVRLAKDGIRKTHIQFGANLSWSLTVRYLKKMVSGGLLVIESDKQYYATKEGKRWLGYYDRMMAVTPEELTT